MKLRSLARGATLTTAALLFATPAATTVHAAEAPACAKEQLAYLEAEDKAHAADKDADAAAVQAAFDQAERDRATLHQTTDHIVGLADAIDSLAYSASKRVATEETELKELQKEYDAAVNATDDARKARDASDAAGVADAAEKAVAAARRSRQVAKHADMTSYKRVDLMIRLVEKDAVAARKATTAKDYDSLKEKAQQSQANARAAHDAVPAARSELKTCLSNATK
ncbi:hypothetical protein [Streptomyces huasconensis]|uniref:hypothetical protein n=1 Tax=Streptomyces huasconensis TaxID=1854574 RepID=UPI0033D36129